MLWLEMLFGGVKDFGYGLEGGLEVLELYFVMKLVMVMVV